MPLFRIVRCCVILVLAGSLLAVGGCHRHRKSQSGKYQLHSGTVGYTGASQAAIPQSGPSLTWTDSSNPPSAWDQQILTLINNQRTAQGLNPLTWHDGLAAVAQVHAINMHTNGYLSLVAPGGYDVFESLVTANPPMSFTNAFAMVVQMPGPPWPNAPGTVNVLMSAPGGRRPC